MDTRKVGEKADEVNSKFKVHIEANRKTEACPERSRRDGRNFLKTVALWGQALLLPRFGHWPR